VKYISSFVDFVSIHHYPDSEGNIGNFGLLPVDRPVVLEEFGVNRTCFARDKEAEIYRAYLDEAVRKNMSGAMFWNLGLGNNSWDRWEDQDRHLFDVVGSSPLFVNTLRPSISDRIFFSVGSNVQFLLSNSGHVTSILITIAVIVGVGFVLLRRLS